MAGLLFSLLLFGSSFLVAFIYPNVGKAVLHFTFWGIIIAACVQPAKVLNSILGNGILPSGGDTKYILLGRHSFRIRPAPFGMGSIRIKSIGRSA